LTIYEKLVADFQRNTPKYVFQGIAEFATNEPWIITGDNYEDYRGVDDMFGRVEINIFNISKLNRDARETKKGGPRIRELRETMGESYFDYLKGLPDLVLLMDESHRYRADAGVRALNELNPLIGLELTATPFVDKAKGQEWFKNVIFDYPLARAIEDGFVKDPAVATQRDFNRKDFSTEELERVKLEDGVRLHQETKLELDTYARQTGRRKVKPFMLVIAKDTTHAAKLLETVESTPFFGGAYRGKALQVDSSTKEEEVVAKLLSVESVDNPVEIVIHVNMLKEGWDVNNLYTIVPLRAANARTLIEQSIGRGLRLPYGHRTGVEAVDRLTIVAHDRFDEIIEEANRPDSPVRIKKRFIEKPSNYKKLVQVIARPNAEIRLFGEDGDLPAGDESGGGAGIFKTKTEQAAGRLALELFRSQQSEPIARLQDAEVEKELAQKLERSMQPSQLEMEVSEDPIDYSLIIRKAAQALIENTIEIPQIVIEPTGEVSSGFNPFTVDTSEFDASVVDREILLQYLNDNRQASVRKSEQGWLSDKRPEDYIVRRLREYDDVNYDEQADLLYDLAGQVVEHLRQTLPDDEKLIDVLQYREHVFAKNIHAQMQEHFWEKSAGQKPRILQGWMALKECPFNADDGKACVPYHQAPEKKSEIRKYVFSGFERCIYPFQKFDSDGERRLAAILEREALKWFKPATGQFRLYYRLGRQAERSYEPDFVVETATSKYLIEVKADDELEDDEVLAKAEVGRVFCSNATDHSKTHGGKPWTYVLLSDSRIASNVSLEKLLT
jgi:type III restriction enzyme